MAAVESGRGGHSKALARAARGCGGVQEGHSTASLPETVGPGDGLRVVLGLCVLIWGQVEGVKTFAKEHAATVCGA